MSEEERIYAGNFNTHVDFLIINRATKQPLLGIEIDGYAYHHKGTVQSSRDALKDHIFKSYHLQLLRLSTKGANEEEKVKERLDTICWHKCKHKSKHKHMNKKRMIWKYLHTIWEKKKIGIFLRMDSMKKASEQELWYENIRYRFYPGLQVTFDKKTVKIRFAYKKNNGFSIADYNNPDEKKGECKLNCVKLQ